MSRIADFHSTNDTIFAGNLEFLSKCFGHCIKDRTLPILNESETECAKFCLEKHIETGILVGRMKGRISMADQQGKILSSRRILQEYNLTFEDLQDKEDNEALEE